MLRPAASQSDERWLSCLGKLRQWLQKNAGTYPARGGRTKGERSLARWVNNQQQKHHAGHLSDLRRRRLEGLRQWSWSQYDKSWYCMRQRLQKWLLDNDGEYPVQRARGARASSLARWVNNQRTNFNAGLLSTTRRASLENLPGWVWDANRDAWIAMFDAFKAWQTWEDGRPRVEFPRRGATRLRSLEEVSDEEAVEQELQQERAFAAWMNEQRKLYHSGKLDEHKVQMLESIPHWSWVAADTAWQDMYEAVVGFLTDAQSKAKDDPDRFLCSDVTEVLRDKFHRNSTWSVWVERQRCAYREGKLCKERTEALAALPGWTWDHQTRWDRNYNMVLSHLSANAGAYPMQSSFLGQWLGKQLKALQYKRRRLTGKCSVPKTLSPVQRKCLQDLPCANTVQLDRVARRAAAQAIIERDQAELRAARRSHSEAQQCTQEARSMYLNDFDIQVPLPAEAPCHAERVTFGIHKGSTFQELRNRYPSYCALIAESTCGGACLHSFQRYLRMAPHDCRIGFGSRNPGKRYGDVAAEDAYFTRWARAVRHPKTPGLRHFQKYLLRYVPDASHPPLKPELVPRSQICEPHGELPLTLETVPLPGCLANYCPYKQVLHTWDEMKLHFQKAGALSDTRFAYGRWSHDQGQSFSKVVVQAPHECVRLWASAENPDVLGQLRDFLDFLRTIAFVPVFWSPLGQVPRLLDTHFSEIYVGSCVVVCTGKGIVNSWIDHAALLKLLRCVSLSVSTVQALRRSVACKPVPWTADTVAALVASLMHEIQIVPA